jgi:hypothetical protein
VHIPAHSDGKPMLISLVMLLLLIAVFLSCGALIGFAESIIAPQGEARGVDGD